jgi:hypothetical protein
MNPIRRKRKSQAKLFQFVSQIEKNCHANQDRLIEEAKICGAFGEVDWADSRWDITSTEIPKTRSHKNNRKNHTIWFTQHKLKGQAIGEPFGGKFADIVKSLVRFRAFQSNQVKDSQMVFIRGCRYIYEQLEPKRHDITNLTQEDLNNAASAALSREAETSAYKVIGHMEEFAGLVDSNGLSKARLSWKFKKNRRPSSLSPDRLDDPEAVKARHAKLPSEAAIRAVGHLYQIIPRDDWKNRVLILIATLCCLLGRRIGETLTFPCQKVKTDAMGRKYLLYYPQKISAGNIYVYARKLPLLSKTADLVESVINELIDRTERQREVAKWIRENQQPDLRDLELTAFDESSLKNLKRFLGIKEAVSFLHGRGIKTYKKPNSQESFFRVSELAAILRNELFLRPALHVTERNQNLYLEDILAITFRNGLNSQKRTLEYAVEPINEQHIYGFLVGNKNKISIFNIYGMADEDGGIIKISSHKFRHYLNNLLDEGGAPDLVQAEYFGRKFIGDNKAYQHQTPVLRALKFREAVKDGKINGSVANVCRILPKDKADAFLDARAKAVFDVGTGYCVHDFLQAPCWRQCSESCPSFHWIENPSERAQMLRRMYAVAWKSLETTKQKVADGYDGAAKWIEHLQKVLDNISFKLGEIEGQFNEAECLKQFEGLVNAA